MMVLFGLTADMGFPFYLIVLEITILFPVIPGLLGNNDRNTDLPHLEKFLCSYRPTKGSGGCSGFVCIYDLYVLQIPDIAAGNFGDVISTSTFYTFMQAGIFTDCLTGTIC